MKSTALLVGLLVAASAQANAVVVVSTGAAAGASANAARQNNISEYPDRPIVADAVVSCETEVGTEAIVGCRYRKGWADFYTVSFKAHAKFVLKRDVEVVGLSYNEYRDRMDIYVRYKGEAAR